MHRYCSFYTDALAVSSVFLLVRIVAHEDHLDSAGFRLSKIYLGEHLVSR